jgi:hypothetical protein
MIHTPGFIVFRVEIEGKEFLGRPISVGVDSIWNPGVNQQGLFQTYSTIQSFMAGYINNEMKVTSETIKGIEAIDTVDNGPLNNIFTACHEIDDIPSIADIGVIKRYVPKILQALSASLTAYEELHNLNRYALVFEEIDQLAKECGTLPYNLSEIERKNFIRNLKEKVSINVTRLIELSGWPA